MKHTKQTERLDVFLEFDFEYYKKRPKITLTTDTMFAMKQPLPNQSSLWKQFKTGNQTAFSSLYRHFYPSMYFFALKATCDPEEAQECVQELFVTLWNRRQQLGDVSQVKAYLFRSLRRLIHRRSSTRAMETTGPVSDSVSLTFSPEDFLIRQEDATYQQDTLAAVLNQLPPRQREAVYLKYYENLSYSQIAEVLRINYQSAVNLVYQAFRQLRQQPTLRQLVRLAK